jgi:hypothetical protein
MKSPFDKTIVLRRLETGLLAIQQATEMYAVSDNPNATVLNRLTTLRDAAEKEYNSFLGFATAPDAA